MFSQLLAVAVLAFSAQSAVAASDCSRTYTIQAGDYCDKISQAHNVSTYQLAVSNKGKYKSDCTDLRIGGELCLALKPEEDCKETYIVSPGDNCLQVASNHGLNFTILRENNPQIDEECSNIYVGEVLCVAKSVQVTPIPADGVTVPAPGASSSVLSSTPVRTPTAVPTHNNDNDDDCEDDSADDDDEDLPFCDEL
ncbi:hypothetical protein CPC08DRAFT_681548 [Agrocybe pediades]|nr:hypothetical protein CPC08DRAFT_681548 [Agrocybe pediades]